MTQSDTDSGADATKTGAQNQQEHESKDEAVDTVTLSKEELDKKLQTESDKRVTEALKTAKAKWESEFKKKLEEEKKEAAKMSKLSEEEKHRVLLEKRERELEEKERRLLIQSLKLESVKILEDKKLPASFVDWLIGSDADETYANIQAFEKAFQEAVQNEVQNRLPKRIPKVGDSKKEHPGATFDAQIRKAAGRK